MREMKSFWRVGIARNAVFSRILWLCSLAKTAPKDGRVWEHFLKFKPAKFTPRCGERAVSNSKTVKTGAGSLFEIQVCKICTTLRRKSDCEAKTVQTPGSWSIVEIQSVFRVASAGISTKRPYNC